MTSRALARQKDRPPVLIIGPTPTQLDQIDYRETELARLQEELEELRGRLASVDHLETFRDLLSLNCPKNIGRKTTILECVAYRKRGTCLKKHCLPRQGLLAKISL